MNALSSAAPSARASSSSPLAAVSEVREVTPILAAAAKPVLDECERRALIHKLSRLLHEPGVPEHARSAGLTVIGWLARRMHGEAADTCGLPCDGGELELAPRSMRRTKNRG